MKSVITSLLALLLWQNVKAQSVGINTNSPHPSSILDISSTNKGVLLPKIALQSPNDNITIPNPANGLLLYNTNTQMGPEGLYYNSGDANNALWQMAGTKLSLPFSQSGSSNVALFYIGNSGNSPNSIAISGSSEIVGVRGASNSGVGVSGTSSNGVGVFASSSSGLALHVFGKLKISGNSQTPGQGKVLTSDANGYATWQAPAINLIAFSEVGIDGGGNINSSGGQGFVTVNFSDLVYNHGGGYNAPSNSFTAPVNGIYHFDAMVEWIHANPNLNFNPNIKLVRKRNNVETAIAFDWETKVVLKHTSVITIDCELFQGDVVFIQGMSGTNGIELETSSSTAHFNGRLLQKL